MMLQMDRLYESVQEKGHVCVGLDTDFSYLPEGFADPALTAGENIVRFNKALIDATRTSRAATRCRSHTTSPSGSTACAHINPLWIICTKINRL